MLSEKLKQKEYYLSKLNLFSRNSYGIEAQMEVFWKLLIDTDSSIDDVFSALKMENVDEITNMLDKIAAIVGVSRTLVVSYYIESVLNYFTLTLTNQELYRLIQTRIVQNNFKGTFEDFTNNYSRIGLEVLAFDTATSAELDLILNDSPSLTDNDKRLFLSGNYTIRSLGIQYTHKIQMLALIGIWDNLTSTYDSAEWSD